MEAYRNLEGGSYRDKAGPSEEYRKKIESAIADIQILGSEHQANLARECAEDLERGGEASAGEFLTALRNNLRVKLDLEKLTGEPKILRFRPPTAG